MEKDYTKSNDVILKGSSKKVTFDNGGSVTNHSINVKQLVAVLDWYNKERESRGLEPTDYLSFTTKERKNKDDFGNTHFNLFAPWFPEAKSAPVAAPTVPEVKKETNELPWE